LSRSWQSFGIRCATVVKNEKELEKFFLDRNESHRALGAVVFDEQSFDGDRVRRNATVRYKIRLRAEQYNGTYKQSQDPLQVTSDIWLTDHVFPKMPTVGPRGDMYGDPVPGKDEQRLFAATV